MCCTDYAVWFIIIVYDSIMGWRVKVAYIVSCDGVELKLTRLVVLHAISPRILLSLASLSLPVTVSCNDFNL